MPQVVIDRDRCKGCEMCMNACPQTIIEMSKKMNVKGYFPAQIVDQPRCIGCTLCAVICPDIAIEVSTNGVQYQFFEY